MTDFEKKNTQNFMQIPPVAAELFHADRQMEGHDEADSRFSLCEDQNSLQRIFQRVCTLKRS